MRRIFKYEQNSLSWFEIITPQLTTEQLELLKSNIGEDIATLDVDLLKQKIDIQVYIEECKNTTVSEEKVNELTIILCEIEKKLNLTADVVYETLHISDDSKMYYNYMMIYKDNNNSNNRKTSNGIIFPPATVIE